MNSILTIRGLVLHVKLGWPDKERLLEQDVRLDVNIRFPEPPKACVSDNLDDTLCYSLLIKHLRASIANKHWHLIEHLSHEIYHIIKSKLPKQSSLSVRITKKPNIEGLSKGVSFEYGDG